MAKDRTKTSGARTGKKPSGSWRSGVRRSRWARSCAGVFGDSPKIGWAALVVALFTAVELVDGNLVGEFRAHGRRPGTTPDVRCD
jgi:hypothetical protein